MQNLILSPIDPDKLISRISEQVTENILKAIGNDKLTQLTEPAEQLLTREQTCEFLQIDSSTLWHWTNKGKVKAYGIGNRRYYKRAELLESLQPLKQKGGKDE